MAGEKNNNALFADEELEDLIKDEQHQQVITLLQQLIDNSNDSKKWEAIAKAVQGNAAQLSRFVEALKALRIEVPPVNVAAPNVTVDVKQEEVVKAIGGMFAKMEEFLTEVIKSNDKLSANVQAMNESYRADKVMAVSWHSGMVDQITVRIKK